MKVLYISYDGAMDPLGMSQVLPYLKGLADKGVVIDLLTFEKKDSLADGKRVAALRSDLEAAGIKWHYLRYHKSPTVPATLFDILCGIISGIRISAAGKITIVHARGYISSMIAVVLKKIYGVRFIFDMRGLWADEKVDAGAWKKDGLVYRAVKRIERGLFLNADWAVTLSQRGEDILKSVFKIKSDIAVVPTCVDLKLFTPAPRDPIKRDSLIKPVYLYLGSLGSWYMLEEMVDFFKEAIAAGQKPFFLFINRRDKAMIDLMMKRKGVGAGDYRVEAADYSRVGLSASQADVSLFFIRPFFSKIVSCPTKFGESLACGLPVIVNSGIGDVDRIVADEKVGVVVKDFSPSSYRLALIGISALLSEGEDLRKRCREAAKKYFSLEIGVEKYYNIYQQLEKLE